MGNTEMIPDSIDFTKEVEGTIDHLFNPVRDIVIDPVTNEVKEVGRHGSVSLDQGGSLAMAETKPPGAIADNEGSRDGEVALDLKEAVGLDPGGPDGEAATADADTPTVGLTAPPLDMELDLDLALEMEGAAPPEVSEQVTPLTDTQGSPPPRDALSVLAAGGPRLDTPELMDQLNQTLLTLEWEVSGEHVANTQGLLRSLTDALTSDDSADTALVLAAMARVLGILSRQPERAPAEAPKALRYSLDVLRTAITDSGQDPAGRRALIESALGRLRLCEEKSATPPQGSAAAEKTEQLGGTEDKGPVLSVPKQRVTGPEVPLLTIRQPKGASHAAVSDLPKDRAPHIGRDHSDLSVSAQAGANRGPQQIAPAILSALRCQIDALDQCIARLRPMEELLSRTSGMGKLWHFHQDLRQDLEDQRDRLHSCLSGCADIDISQMAPQRERSRKTQGRPIMAAPCAAETACPWERLVVTSSSGVRIAVPSEQVAFAGPATWRARRQLRGTADFGVSSLKTWPWSRLQGLLGDPMNRIPEAQLRKMRLPVIKDPPWSYGQPSSHGDRPHLLILYKKDQGAVLVTDDSTREVTDLPAGTWLPSTDARAPWAGHVEIEGERLPIVDVNRVLARDRSAQ